jgi:hypothetical protein
MDFIVGLPKVGKKLVIMVVVDCISKYANFCALSHPFTLSLASHVCMNHILKLHVMPTSIISDWDPTFTNIFW